MSDQAHVISHEAEASPLLREMALNILHDVGRIVQSEIRLAKTELGEKASRAGKAAGLLAAAGVIGLLAGACLVTTCIAALALVIPIWLAALIMGVLLGLAATVAFAVGRGRIRHIDPTPHQTVQTLEDNIKWAKQRTR